jgi:hypothetical protein
LVNADLTTNFLAMKSIDAKWSTNIASTRLRSRSVRISTRTEYRRGLNAVIRGSTVSALL